MGTEVTIVEFMPNIVPLKTKTFRNKWSVLEKSRNQNHETRLLRELILGAGVKHL
jgi:hypothetical protein